MSSWKQLLVIYIRKFSVLTNFNILILYVHQKKLTLHLCHWTYDLCNMFVLWLWKELSCHCLLPQSVFFLVQHVPFIKNTSIPFNHDTSLNKTSILMIRLILAVFWQAVACLLIYFVQCNEWRMSKYISNLIKKSWILKTIKLLCFGFRTPQRRF